MALKAVTRDGVLRAVAEFDELGKDAFLAKYGYGPATTYSLVVDGTHYDPKAIVGVAHQFDRPDLGALKNNELVGGRTGSSAVLDRLEQVVRPGRHGRECGHARLDHHERVHDGRVVHLAALRVVADRVHCGTRAPATCVSPPARGRA